MERLENAGQTSLVYILSRYRMVVVYRARCVGRSNARTWIWIWGSGFGPARIVENVPERMGPLTPRSLHVLNNVSTSCCCSLLQKIARKDACGKVHTVFRGPRSIRITAYSHAFDCGGCSFELQHSHARTKVHAVPSDNVTGALTGSCLPQRHRTSLQVSGPA